MRVNYYPPYKKSAIFTLLVLMLICVNKNIYPQACTTSPPCPNIGDKTIYSIYDPITSTAYWDETTAVFCSGEKLTIHAPFSPNISLSTSSMFYNDYNFRCDGSRIGQLSNGDYSFGSTNRFNYIGDDVLSANNPWAAIPMITGFHNFYNQVNAVFGTYNPNQLSSNQINPVVYWHYNGDEGASTKLQFIYKENTLADKELACITSNGNMGINASYPLSRLEVKGGLRVTDQTSGITTPDGFIYASGGIHMGSESFISSVAGNTYIATYPGTKTALGLNNPAAYLHLHALNTGGTNHFKITTNATGDAATDGLTIDMNGLDVNIVNNENGDIRFYTSGNQKFRITNSGNILPNIGATYEIGSSSLDLYDIFSHNFTLTSDRNKKKNIVNSTFGLSEILKLNPVTYNWQIKDNGTRIGLIAQDVEKIIPEIVVKETDTTGIEHYGLRYIELIPVLINAIKEQHFLVTSLTKRIEQIENNYAVTDNVNSKLKGYLLYNIPNPLNNETTIYFHLPIDSKNNKIIITDSKNYKKVMEIPIDNIEKGYVKINCNNLPNGVYIYSLITSDELIDSKKFIKE